jgi:putative ABC transport system permease protein
MVELRYAGAMARDLKYALRTLGRNPGFTAVAVATLALGIGANTAIFSLADALLLRALPYRQPDRLVLITGDDLSAARFGRLSYPFYRLVNEYNRSYSSVAACTFDSFSLSGHGDPQQIESARADWNFFEMLGVHPLAGRTFRPEEDRVGGANVVVLSHELATQLFADAKSAVGRNLSLNSQDYTVIGVLRPDFSFTLFGPRREIWAPRPFEMNLVTPARVELGGTYFNLIGRLHPGVSRDQARAELGVLYQQYRREKPGNFDAGLSLKMDAIELQGQLVAQIRMTLLILTAAVGFVLLIACANVASLLLSRALGRRKEFAVRAALGGSRSKLIRQLLTESILVAIAAGAIGVALAYAGTRVLSGIGAASSFTGFGTGGVSIDSTVLAFTLAISVASGILFGLAPSFELSKTDVNTALRDEGRGSTGTLRRNRLRAALVVGQVALSMVLLVGSGLLMRSFIRLRNAPPGFDPSNVLAMHMTLPPGHYSKSAQMIALYRDVLTRAERVPGVEAAAISTALPAAQTHSTPILYEGQPAVALGQRPIDAIQQISPQYLKVMRIALIAGRMLDARDNEKSKLVALVNQTAARKYWPSETAVGKRLWVGTIREPFEVVGVIGDTKNNGLAAAPSPEVFIPYPQLPYFNMQVTIRTTIDPHSLASAVRAQLLAADRDQPVTEIQTMQEYLETFSASARFTTVLLGIFSGVAFLLAVVGLYGVIAYSVAQRRQELGIRIALGAAKSEIFRQVIGGGLILTAVGIMIGVAGSIALTRAMSHLLYETSATDPAIFAVSIALFTATALAASYFPARRAAKIDPTVALRGE